MFLKELLSFSGCSSKFATGLVGFLVMQRVWELDGVKSFKGHFLLRVYFCPSGKENGQNHLLLGLSLLPSTEMQQILFNFI